MGVLLLVVGRLKDRNSLAGHYGRWPLLPAQDCAASRWRHWHNFLQGTTRQHGRGVFPASTTCDGRSWHINTQDRLFVMIIQVNERQTARTKYQRGSDGGRLGVAAISTAVRLAFAPRAL